MAMLARSVRLLMAGVLAAVVLPLTPAISRADPGPGDPGESFRERSIEWARDQLTSTDSLTRVRALRHLGFGGVPVDEYLDLACELATDPNPLVRQLALGVLGEMAGLSAEDRARRWAVFQTAIFRDPDEGVRAQACATAISEPIDGPPDVLLALLDDGVLDPYALLAVASVLGRVGYAERAVEEIVPGIASPNEKAVWRAVSALRSLGADARPAVPALLDLLQVSDDDWLRGEIVSALVEIGDPSGRAADALRRMVDTRPDLDWSTTGAAAAGALARLGDPKGAVERLAAHLRSGPDSTRWDAASALESIPEAVAAYAQRVTGLLGDPNPDVRALCLQVLDAAGIGELVKPELLALAAHDDDPGVRLEAVRALAMVGTGDEALALLLEQCEHAPAAEREQSEMAVVEMAGTREEWKPDGLKAALTDLLESDSALVRVAALAVLYAREPAEREALVERAKQFAEGEDAVLAGEAIQFLADVGLVNGQLPEELAAVTRETRQTTALSNARQLLTAILGFAEDYDGLLPGAEWAYAIHPHIANCRIYGSPGNGGAFLGFALNESVAGVDLTTISRPGETVLFFEAEGADENPIGGKERLADWWGDGTVVLVFADAHAKACTREQVEGLEWSPAPTRPPAP